MPKQTLSLVAGGYFLYPIGDDRRCRVIAAPRVTGVTHRCCLFIKGKIAQASGVDVTQMADWSCVELRDSTVRFTENAVSSGGGARVSSVESIVPFHEVCCGAKLNSGWRSLVNVAIELPPGAFGEHPGEPKNTVQWVSCRTRRLMESEFVSSGTTLTTWPDWDGIIRIEPQGQIRMADADVQLIFSHTATDTVAPVTEDLAHVASMLEICDPIDQLQLEFGIVLKEERADIFERFGIRAKPRINCGGRWIEA